MSLFVKLKTAVGQELADFLPWVLMTYMGGILAFFAGESKSMVLVLGITGLIGLFISLFQKRIGILVLSFCLGWGNIAAHTYFKEHSVLSSALYQTRIEADVAENQVLTDRQILTLDHIYWQNPDLKMPENLWKPCRHRRLKYP